MLIKEGMVITQHNSSTNFENNSSQSSPSSVIMKLKLDLKVICWWYGEYLLNLQEFQ